MKLYAGLDLHSRNTYIGKKVPNHLEQVLKTLARFRDQIKGFGAVFWTCNGSIDSTNVSKILYFY